MPLLRELRTRCAPFHQPHLRTSRVSLSLTYSRTISEHSLRTNSIASLYDYSFDSLVTARPQRRVRDATKYSLSTGATLQSYFFTFIAWPSRLSARPIYVSRFC